jgi:hypothetical protein
VLTLGGYHPDFHRDGYPVVPGLGLSINLFGFLSITGQTYFALTSEAVMPGSPSPPAPTGFSATMDDWAPSFVDALAAHHRVVVFDNAGVGETAALPGPLTSPPWRDKQAP